MREHALDIGALAMEQMAAQIKEELKVKQELQVPVFISPYCMFYLCNQLCSWRAVGGCSQSARR